MAQFEIQVQWVRQRRQGEPERWHAHLVKPFKTYEFAWLIRHEDGWHLDVCADGRRFRELAVYASRRPDVAMKHLQRWIIAADRWDRLVLARGAEDPRGLKFEQLRHQPSGYTYMFNVGLRRKVQNREMPQTVYSMPARPKSQPAPQTQMDWHLEMANMLRAGLTRWPLRK